MTMARVRGTVVATRRSDGVAGAKWLLVEDCDQRGAGRGEYLVALDMVGAERGQLVLLTQGSSCRWTHRTDDKPMDTLVVAIVDQIDQAGAFTWNATQASAAGQDTHV
jgi:microcompartment protein CcmK/EutM